MSALVVNTDDKQVTQNEQPKLKTDNKYVVLCETNDNEMEQWYYFIKLNGNEEALQHLQSQLEKVDMTLEEELSTFDLDLDHTFSEQTASEMIRLEVNTHFHRKFDGTLQKIDLKLNDGNSNMKMLRKCTRTLGGWSGIEDYVSEEEEVSGAEYESESSESESESDDSESDDSEEEHLKTIPEDVPKAESNTKNQMLFPVPVQKVAGGRRKKKRNP